MSYAKERLMRWNQIKIKFICIKCQLNVADSKVSYYATMARDILARKVHPRLMLSYVISEKFKAERSMAAEINCLRSCCKFAAVNLILKFMFH